MSAFRILNQAPQYLLASGEVNAGGSLTFYETDLSTPKNTWSDEGLTTLNPNPVEFDAAGRTETDVWGDGEYGVVCKDAEGTTIWTRNNVRVDAGASQEIPALVSGQFLTNDGSNLAWQAISEVPDPTGLNNYYLVSDGTATPIWQQIPEPEPPPDPEIVVGANSFQAGTSEDATKFYIQSGTGSVAASGTREATANVTFPEVFDTLEHVTISMQGSGFTSLNDIPRWSVASQNTAGFSIRFMTGENSTFAGWNITSTINFTWIAFGTLEVP